MKIRLPALGVVLVGVATVSVASALGSNQTQHLLQLDVTVSQADGSPFNGVRADELQVAVAGTPVRPGALVSHPEPLSVFLLVDVTSSSVERMFRRITPFSMGRMSGPVSPLRSGLVELARITWAGRLPRIVEGHFIGHLSSFDRVRLGTFGARLVASAAFTSDRSQLARDLETLIPPEAANTVGATRIWDVTHEAVRMAALEPGRRAIVLLTDGEATGNRLVAEDVIAEAVERDVPVHVISLSFDRELPQIDDTAVTIRANDALRRVAQETGGTFQFQGEDRVYASGVLTAPILFGPRAGRPPDYVRQESARWDDPGPPFRQVAQALHQAYRLSVPVDLPPGDDPIPVRVKSTRPGVQVHVKAYIPRPGAAPPRP